MKCAGGAIVRFVFVNKPKLVWKNSEREPDFSTSLQRVGDKKRRRRGEGVKNDERINGLT
jgi:hypothetical protein